MVEDEGATLNSTSGNITGPTPSKVTKIVPLSSVDLMREIRASEDTDSGSGAQRIFILVPVMKRRASLSSNQSSSSGSDNESCSYRQSAVEEIQQDYTNKEFNAILSTFGLEVDKSSSSINEIDFTKPNIERSIKRPRKVFPSYMYI